jgi:hypothetical protein
MPRNISRASIPRVQFKRLSRRRVLQVLTSLGVGTTVFRRALAAETQASGSVTPEMIQQAEWIAGIELKPEARTSTARALIRALRDFQQLRSIKLDNSVPPALVFSPTPAEPPAAPPHRGQVRLADSTAPARPASDEDLAFLPVTALAALIRTRQVTSTELTKLYLDRLRRYDGVLKCVITYTDELALKQAERADREIATGQYRGPWRPTWSCTRARRSGPSRPKECRATVRDIGRRRSRDRHRATVCGRAPQ